MTRTKGARDKVKRKAKTPHRDLAAKMRKAGWTLVAIGELLGISRQAVQHLLKTHRREEKIV